MRFLLRVAAIAVLIVGTPPGSHGAPVSRPCGRPVRAGIFVGVLVLILFAVASAGRAGETSGEKCSVTKLRAAFKNAGREGACFEKAIAKAAMADPTCLGKADAAFGLAFQKAEARGGCVTTGDVTAVEATVDSCVNNLVDELTGVSVTTPNNCGLGQLPCGGTCVNIATDANNCGACGVVCSPAEGLVCLSGTCVCPPPTTFPALPAFCGSQCDVRPCICTNLLTDPRNCGACGTVCPSTAPICSGGACTCPANCGGTCVDTQTDPSNCGACGNVCPPSAPTCAGGTCETTTTTTTTTSTTTSTIIGRWHNGDLFTLDQSAWGCSRGSGFLLTNYSTVYAATFDVLTVGLPNGGFSFVFTGPLTLLDYLPVSGPPGPLNQNLVDPTTTSSGIFGGDVVALKLNLDFSRLAFMPGTTGLTIGNLTLCNFTGTLTGLNVLTVRQVLPIANTLLGGGTASFSIADLDPVIADINRSFDGGFVSSFAQDHLFNGACP